MNFTPGDFKYSNLGSEVTNPFPCPLTYLCAIGTLKTTYPYFDEDCSALIYNLRQYTDSMNVRLRSKDSRAARSETQSRFADLEGAGFPVNFSDIFVQKLLFLIIYT